MNRPWLLVWTAAIGVAACGGDGTGPESRLQILAPTNYLVEGSAMELGLSAGGERIDAARARWETSDSSTLRVSSGVVRGIAPGFAYVMATDGDARDSVPIRVRFAQGAVQGSAIRIAGEAGDVIRLRGRAVYNEVIGTTFRHMQIRASNIDIVGPYTGALEGDSVLFINIPGTPALGNRPLGPMRVEPGDDLGISGESGVFLHIRDSGSRLRFYIGVTDAQLEITEIQYPDEPGRVPGVIRGSIAFEAAGLLYDGETIPHVSPLGDTTVMVYAEFSTPVHHILSSQMSATLENGPYAGVVHAGGHVRFINGGAWLQFSGFQLAAGELARDFDGRVWFPSLTAGPHAVGVVSPTVLTDSLGATVPWARLTTRPIVGDQLGEAEHSFSDGGTITITNVRPPTQDAFGVIEGEIVTTLRYWTVDPNQQTDRTQVLRSRFAMPIDPLGGHPLFGPF